MSLNIKTETGKEILASLGGNVINGAEMQHFSTDERIIGYWTNGAPIYRKFILISDDCPISQDLSSLNISQIIKIYPMRWHNSQYIDEYRVYYDSTTKKLIYPEIKYYAYVYIEYTKTGDTLITNNNTYSTDEVITGKTWIDGKPIYRKVLSASMPQSITDGVLSSNHVILSDLNIDSIISVKASNSVMTIPRVWNVSNTNYQVSVSVINSDNVYKLEMSSDRSSQSGVTYNVILEYTKTTD